MTTNRQVLLEGVRDIYEASAKSAKFYLKTILGETAWSKQQEIMDAVDKHKVVTVRSCHDAGKSYTAARTALRYLSIHPDSIVITTAPTNRQVEEILWREIRGAHSKAKQPLGGTLLKMRLDVDENWYAIGFSTDDPNMFQGFHPPSGHILVIADEPPGILEPIFEAIDAVLTSEHARLLMIGNPTSLSGRFYDSHHKDKEAHKIHISCFDTPNFTNNGIRNLDDLQRIDMAGVEIVAPYLITPAWVKDKITRWGIDSPMFQARCLGQFPSTEDNSLIPLNLIEQAATDERRAKIEIGELNVGVDVARFGNDKTIICPRFGNNVQPMIKRFKEATTQTVGRVKQLHGAESYNIDDIGVGGGVTDQLIEDRVENVNGVNVGAKANDPQFVNLRAELYWKVAELFKAGDIAIPDDPELISQLASIHYEFTRHGIKIEDKEQVRKRIGRSPDEADALILSFADYAGGNDLKPSMGKTYQELYDELNQT